MKFRWSDGHSFAVEFECDDESNFYSVSLAALTEARQHNIKRYHQQGLGQQMFFPALYLHIAGVDGTWLNPSRTDEPSALADCHIKTLVDDVLNEDKSWLLFNCSRLWRQCARTYNWSCEFEKFYCAVNNMIQDMDQKIKNEKLAVEQFQKMVTQKEK